MRCHFVISLFALIILTAHAWDTYDYEIFDLVSELEAAEGKATNFYSFIGVESTASAAEIGKAYRKKSVTEHPDKNPGVKGVHERFARLGAISTILRNEETRKRYDFFYKNGVPRWRGTGYYYARFRPGLGTVISFLIILTSGIQYIVQSINYRKDLARIEQFISKARLAAWGPKLNRIEGQRKVKVPAGGGAYIEEDWEYTSATKWIDMVVEGDDVYILEPDGQLLPLDKSAATPPGLGRTWFLGLVKTLYQRIEQYRTGSPQTKTNGTESEDAGEWGSSGGTRTLSQGRGVGTSGAGRRKKAVRRR